MTLLSAVVPFSVSVTQSIGLQERALRATLLEVHDKALQLGTNAVSDHLGHLQSSLRTLASQTITWTGLSPEERQGAMWLVYGQSESIALVELRRASEVLDRVFHGEVEVGHPMRAPVTASDIEVFDHVVPPLGADVVIGVPSRAESGLLLPLVLSAGEPLRVGESPLTIAIGLSLASLCERLAQGAPLRGSITLLDRAGRRVCAEGRVSELELAPESLRSSLVDSVTHYQRTSERGEQVEGAAAPVLGNWHVVVEQPSSVIDEPLRAVRNQALLWMSVGAIAAVVSGLVLADSIRRSLGALMRGVQELGKGNLAFRLAPVAGREFNQLGQAFNTMSEEISKRDLEIQTWNNELKERVEQRTKELERTQHALLRTRKMAGLAALTAGVAHEMNNPLTGILGLTQVLFSRTRRQEGTEKEQELLGSVIKEAERLQQLLREMMQLGQDPEKGFTEVRLRPLVDSVLLAERARAERQEASLEADHTSEDAKVLGDQYLLNKALSGLIDNALRALPERGGRIVVSTGRPDRDWTTIVVRDNGCGIPTEQLEKVFEPFFTTQQGSGKGLGLAQVHQTIEAHGGRIEIRSQPSQGTEVEIRLPVMGMGAHLV